jgi:hypothetical protein
VAFDTLPTVRSRRRRAGVTTRLRVVIGYFSG